jgi:uncharacterized membrane protein AbrB (regulator of aidB expression)
VSFVKLVRPAGPGWAEVRAEAGVTSSPDSLSQALLGWMLGCAMVYAAMFATGNFLYGRLTSGTVCLVICLTTGALLYRLLTRLLGAGSGQNAGQLG